jgi:nicotinamidase-related amidase
MQRDYLSNQARLPIAKHQVPPLIDTINKLTEQADAMSWEVYYIRNEFNPRQLIPNLFRNFATMRGSSGSEFDQRLMVRGDQEYIKSASSAFTNPLLLQDLVHNQVRHIIITGVFAEGCVQATARAALKHGFGVSIVTDAIGSGSDQKREDAIGKMRKFGIDTTTSDELLSLHSKNAIG